MCHHQRTNSLYYVMKPLLRYVRRCRHTFDVYQLYAVEIQVWDTDSQLWMFIGRVGNRVHLTYIKIPSVSYTWYNQYEFIMRTPPINGQMSEILTRNSPMFKGALNDSYFTCVFLHKKEYRIPIEDKDILKQKNKIHQNENRCHWIWNCW